MTTAVSSSRRKALAEARKQCQELIAFVKELMVGEAADDIFKILPRAELLLSTLQSLNAALPDELKYFRDYCCERPLTQLGIPTNEDDDGRLSFDIALGRSWLGHLRYLAQSLREEKPTRFGVSSKSRGGRKKDPEVRKLETQVADLYDCESKSLVKNGVPRPDALKRLRSWSTTEILRKINAGSDRQYPLRGREAETLKKRISRSPAFRSLHGVELKETSEDESESPTVRDAAWAVENGLRPMRAGQN